MKQKKLKAKIKYPGISKDSEKLGVSRQHLWEVLEGNRASKRLSARYAELKAKQATEKGGSK